MTREVTTVSFVHLEHEEKPMFFTAEVLKKLGPKRRAVNEEQPSNILAILLTAEVSNDERSRWVKDEHPENILSMKETNLMSNDERARRVKDEHS